MVGCQAAIAGKPAPTGECVHQKEMVGCQVAIAAMRRPDKPALQRDLAQAEDEVPFTPVKATKKSDA
jgi:hypothetical protein